MTDMQIPPTLKGLNMNNDGMKNTLTYTIWILFIAIILVMIFPSCSERATEPVIMPDSTIVYPSVKPDGISAKITYSRNLGQKSVRQSAISTFFALKEDDNVYAGIELMNRLIYIGRDLMFHIDWIGPDGRSFYLKRIDLAAGDSAATIFSSVSVAPGKRQAGEHLMRVYLFRELIAEKRFYLLPEPEMEKVSANIIFYKSMDKETGEMKGIDTVFEIKKKGILRAQVDLSRLHIYQDEELPFRLEWYGPDGESFYSKRSEIKPSDALSVINGSISITPDKRLPGTYFLRVFLFDDLIVEKKFVLLPAE